MKIFYDINEMTEEKERIIKEFFGKFKYQDDNL